MHISRLLSLATFFNSAYMRGYTVIALIATSLKYAIHIAKDTNFFFQTLKEVKSIGLLSFIDQNFL